MRIIFVAPFAIVALLLSLLTVIAPAEAWAPSWMNGTAAPSANPVFTALHTYYMSPTGSDAAAGTAGAPWATPNHALNCGDVIIAPAGTYNGSFSTWGTVSNCRSTTGGIDGTGGVNFAVLLCGGSDLGSNGCNINCATAACNSGVLGSGGRNAASAAMNINASNWAIEGWTVNGNGATHRGFQVDACLTGSTILHHIALINDISFNNGAGFDINECGYGQSPTYTNGGDYWFVVGNIAQNAAQDSICVAAIDNVGAATWDTNPGTHNYINTNYTYANANTSGCRGVSDTEGIMLDTLDSKNVQYQFVISNNIGFYSDRECIHIFEQNGHPNTPTIKVYNNTCFENNVQANSAVDYLISEIDTNASGISTMTWIVSIQNNIMRQPLAAGALGGSVAGLQTVSMANFTIGGTGNENFIRANNSSCKSGTCNSTNDNESFGTSAQLGTNTYTDPAFTNTTDLLANRLGAPNCTGFQNTTQCMGYDASTNTLTSPSIISDLAATAPGTSGKGFQRPGPCAANADWPVSLKGVVYLHWTGTAIIENTGLVNKPCGV
jgi:hypothetical protein